MQNPTKTEAIQTLPNVSHISKIAVYHTGALGDLLVSTAALFESNKLFPNAEFTLIGCKLWKEVILPNQWPQIKFILELKNKKFTQFSLWQANENLNKWEEIHFHFKNISSFLKKFQMTIDFRTESLRFAWRSYLARVPFRVGGSRSSFSKLLFTHFSIEKSNANIHERDRYLNILSSLNESYIEERKQIWAKHGLPQLRDLNSNIDNKKLILINPTASIREKAWPSEKFRQLAFKLKEQGHEVAIIGSPNETTWLKEVSSEDFKIIQPPNILELIKIVSQAKFLITNTSSMQFIAASTKTPTITLMGLAQPHKWGPLGTWSHFVKGSDSRLNTSLFKPKSVAGKLNEVLSYNSITVHDVLAKIN